MTDRRWTLRSFDAARDTKALQQIDTSFNSHASYRVRADSPGLVLELIAETRQLSKTFTIDLAADAWQHACVALLDDTVCGFMAWAEEPWNRRLVIWHYYVNAPQRGMGGGRLMLNAALAWAAQRGLLTAWAETSNINQPGIEAYRRLGFDICGFDTTLYRGTDTADEFAIYMARSIEEPHAAMPQ